MSPAARRIPRQGGPVPQITPSPLQMNHTELTTVVMSHWTSNFVSVAVDWENKWEIMERRRRACVPVVRRELASMGEIRAPNCDSRKSESPQNTGF